MQSRVEPVTSSQTAAPEMEPPFLFVSSYKGARLDGTHVNHEMFVENATVFTVWETVALVVGLGRNGLCMKQGLCRDDVPNNCLLTELDSPIDSL